MNNEIAVLVERVFIYKHIVSNGHNGWNIPELEDFLKLDRSFIINEVNKLVKAKKLRISKTHRANSYLLIVHNANSELFKQELENLKKQKNEFYYNQAK